MRQLTHTLIHTFLMVCFFYQTSFSAQIFWTGAIDDDWFKAGNWNPAVVPGSSDQAFLFPDLPVEIPSGATVNLISLTVGLADLTISTGVTLNLSGVNAAFGLASNGTIDNHGTINIENGLIYGLLNASSGGNPPGYFTNHSTGIINIGQTGGSFGFDGLSNTNATFINDGGLIKIDNITKNGLRVTAQNQPSSFENINGGQILIGQSGSGSIGKHGIENFASFKNKSGGIILIDNCNEFGIRNFFGNVEFLNDACGSIHLFEPINNIGSFTNAGLLKVETTETHQIFVPITNDGIIEYFLGNPMPNVTNNALIISPVTGSCIMDNVVQIGGANNFVIAQDWFTDEAQTINAGTYISATNQFQLANFSEGSETFFFTVSSANCNFDVSIQATLDDTTPPDLFCNHPTIELDPVTGTKALSLSDVYLFGTDECGPVGSETFNVNQVDCSDIGNAVFVEVTANDGYGNTGTCYSTVTVQDNAKPTMTCQNHTVVLDANTGTGSFIESDVVTSKDDNCAVPSISFSQSSFDCSDVESVEVTATADDGNGNTEACTVTITVEDKTKPFFNNCPAYPNPISTDVGQCHATINFTLPSADDNCEVAVLEAKIIDANTSQTVQNWTTSPNGTYVAGDYKIKWRAKDPSGNKKTCTKTFSIVDDENPNANCEANIEVQLVNGTASITPNELDDGSTDNCNLNLSLSQTDFDCSHLGNNTVTLTASDDDGNQDACTTDVLVKGATLSIESQSKLEGTGSGFTFFFLKITRSDGDCACQVDYSTADGTATLADNDYIERNGTAYFPPSGSLFHYAIVRGVKDSNYESDESFFLELSNATPGVSISGNAEVTLQNDDPVSLIVQNGNAPQGSALIYPNPARSEVFVNLKGFEGQSGLLNIYNSLGQQQMQKVLGEISRAPIRLEITTFENGMYFISLETEGEIQVTQSFIVKK